MDIKHKIEQFKKEIGNPTRYNQEQQKIFAAFTKENGKDINFSITDSEGVTLRLFIKSSDSAIHILKRHYLEEKGKVTAHEILHMFDIIRTGAKTFENNKYTYRKQYKINKTTFTIVISLVKSNGKVALKTFYSNREY